MLLCTGSSGTRRYSGRRLWLLLLLQLLLLLPLLLLLLLQFPKRDLRQLLLPLSRTLLPWP